MPTKVLSATSQLAQIEKTLAIQYKKQAEAAAFAAQQILLKQFARTFAHWDDGEWRGARKFGKPRLEFGEPRITQTRYGITIQQNCVVVAPDGQAHLLWHWLSFGTRPTKALKKSVSFPLRRTVRTEPHNLDAKPFGGFTGEWRTLKKGKVPKGVKPRAWYEGVALEAEKRINRAGGILEGWEFSGFEVHK